MNGAAVFLATVAVFVIFHGARYLWRIRESLREFLGVIRWERDSTRVHCDRSVRDRESESTISSAQIARAKRRRAKK